MKKELSSNLLTRKDGYILGEIMYRKVMIIMIKEGRWKLDGGNHDGVEELLDELATSFRFVMVKLISIFSSYFNRRLAGETRVDMKPVAFPPKVP